MRSRIAALLVLAALAGCRAGDSTRPESLNGSPSFMIQDGAHSNGNPDFFFLNPIGEPSNNPKFEQGAFNPNLKPTVTICALDAATDAAVNAGTLCKTTGPNPYSSTQTISAPTGQAYVTSWNAPVSSDIYYRIAVSVGTKPLGFADVKTASKQSDLKDVNTNTFVPLQDGGNLPIKFRIERYALCEVPGTGPCASETIILGDGGDVNTKIEDEDAGVIIKSGSGTSTHTITVAECDDLNPEVTDLKTFGPCVSVTADPVLPETGLLKEAIVYICAVIPEVEALGEAQHDRVTMHKYDPGVLKAIPHAEACGSQTASNGSLKGFYGAMKRGSFKQAGRQALAMLAPKTLNAAARRLDVGAGGEAPDFSRFQFALPSKLTIVDGNNQVAAPGVLPINPKVIVTDLGGDPVAGATVRFTTEAGCTNGTTVTTLADGFASAPWTIVAGANSERACGRGLAGDDNNGPRTVPPLGPVDPFQPLSIALGDGSDGDAIEVLTGSVMFSATGSTLPNAPIAFGSGGYNTYGPFANTIGLGDAPAGWPSPTGGTSPTIGGTAPFLGVYGGCTVTSGFVGSATFPENTDIFVTKSFNATIAGGTLVATIRVDNDVRVWLDGTELTYTMPPTANGYFDQWTTLFWKHDNCADDAPPVLTVTGLAAGPHTLSLWAHDRGAVGYLDVQIVVTPP
jgi:hypothetical protein